MCFICLTCPDLFIVCFFDIYNIQSNASRQEFNSDELDLSLSSHTQDRIKVHSAQTKAASYGLCVKSNQL